ARPASAAGRGRRWQSHGGPIMIRGSVMSVVRRRLVALGLAAGAFLICSCGGPSKATITGVVTVRGQPPNIEGLTVHFLGMDGRPVPTLVAPKGTYTVTGVAVGEVRVGFTVTDPEGDRVWAAHGQGPGGSSDQPGKARPPEERALRAARSAIRERYRDPLRSGLRTTTARGVNKYNVDLE